MECLIFVFLVFLLTVFYTRLCFYLVVDLIRELLMNGEVKYERKGKESAIFLLKCWKSYFNSL